MFQSVVYSILTGALAGVQFELFANEIPNAALLSAAILHLWTVCSGLLSHVTYQFLYRPKIPFKWSLGVVVLAYVFLHFKSLAMENLPMPVFIVCSNMKLLVTIVIDTIIFSKPFASAGQVVGVLCVTVGCVLITFQSDNFSEGKEYEIEYDMTRGLVYVFLSVIAVSLLLPVSNLAVTKHPGSSFDELFFMQNLLALPLFYPQIDKLLKGVSVLKMSPKVLTLPVPTLVAKTLAAIGEHSPSNTGMTGRFLEYTNLTAMFPMTGHCEGLTMQVPVGLLFMLVTILLTPVHRKQISQVSIAANNSVIGQLIVCAVKTVVLLALFVILHINSNPMRKVSNGFGDTTNVAEYASVATFENVIHNGHEVEFVTVTEYVNVATALGWASHLTSHAMSACIVVYESLRVSISPEIALGVFLQAVGSVGFILTSNAPPALAGKKSFKRSKKRSQREVSSVDEDDTVEDMSVMSVYSSTKTLSAMSPDHKVASLFHSSKHLEAVETRRFVCDSEVNSMACEGESDRYRAPQQAHIGDCVDKSCGAVIDVSAAAVAAEKKPVNKNSNSSSPVKPHCTLSPLSSTRKNNGNPLAFLNDCPSQIEAKSEQQGHRHCRDDKVTSYPHSETNYSDSNNDSDESGSHCESDVESDTSTNSH